MDKKRHEFLEKAWKIIYKIGAPIIKWKFNLSSDEIYIDGPCVIIANHVSGWDPLQLAMSFPKLKLYYVASEHIFRWGILSKIISFLLEPIPRKKGTMGTDTVMMCLRHLKAGHAVVLYAEGNSTWDGLSGKVFPATGKLIRNSGATLVTYRMEGGYLSAPRWGKGTRRGKMYGHKVAVYSPEELKAMKPAEINEIINRDIFEDAWERQKIERVRFKSKNPARYIERAVYLCPECRKVGGLVGSGDILGCSCGFKTRFTEYGTFEPAKPFENIHQWDVWQQKAIKEDDFIHGDILFSDDEMTLSKIAANHEEQDIVSGTVSIDREILKLNEHSFDLKKVENMSLVQASIMLFSYEGEYYQIRANKPRCHRKYLAVWEAVKNMA